MTAIGTKPAPPVAPDPWEGHPLGSALRCVRCLGPAPLLWRTDGPAPT
jgi:hypothetical protein